MSKLTLKLNLPFFISLIIGLNLLIYFRAYYTIEPIETIFAECARNSGRTAAVINLVLILMLAHFGLKQIYHQPKKLKIFRYLICLFAINHLIHFFFVVQNFDLQGMEMDMGKNIHGIFTFIGLCSLPFLVYYIKKLNRIFYFLILIHFVNVTYFISESFYARYKPVDPAYLHRIGVLIMILAVIYMIYRAYLETTIRVKKTD